MYRTVNNNDQKMAVHIKEYTGMQQYISETVSRFKYMNADSKYRFNMHLETRVHNNTDSDEQETIQSIGEQA